MNRSKECKCLLLMMLVLALVIAVFAKPNDVNAGSSQLVPLHELSCYSGYKKYMEVVAEQLPIHVVFLVLDIHKLVRVVIHVQILTTERVQAGHMMIVVTGNIVKQVVVQLSMKNHLILVLRKQIKMKIITLYHVQHVLGQKMKLIL